MVKHHRTRSVKRDTEIVQENYLMQMRLSTQVKSVHSNDQLEKPKPTQEAKSRSRTGVGSPLEMGLRENEQGPNIKV